MNTALRSARIVTISPEEPAMPADALWSFARQPKEVIVPTRSGKQKEADACIQMDAGAGFSDVECHESKVGDRGFLSSEEVRDLSSRFPGDDEREWINPIHRKDGKSCLTEDGSA